MTNNFSSPTLTEHTNKLPAVTLAFWITKIAATTFGETAVDALSMTLKLGYALSSVIFFAVFALLVAAQIRAKGFHRFLYWAVIVATTTVGTTMADFADRSLGVGYIGGSLLLFAALALTLYVWRRLTGSVALSSITTPKAEMFYWLTILFSNTLGTALGDFFADTSGFGYEGSALMFSVGLFIIGFAYLTKKLSSTILFWAAFVLTRPLGAVVGDLLTKPHENGGLNLSRISSSMVIAGFVIICILLTPTRSNEHSDAHK